MMLNYHHNPPSSCDAHTLAEQAQEAAQVAAFYAGHSPACAGWAAGLARDSRLRRENALNRRQRGKYGHGLTFLEPQVRHTPALHACALPHRTHANPPYAPESQLDSARMLSQPPKSPSPHPIQPRVRVWMDSFFGRTSTADLFGPVNKHSRSAWAARTPSH